MEQSAVSEGWDIGTQLGRLLFPQPTSTPPPITDAHGASMVLVPAGPFEMGSEYISRYERPVHQVYLDDFYIDQYEVTNAQYAACVRAGVCQAPTTCDMGEPTYNDVSKADHPVVCVSWHHAQAYCDWRGARLPTEAEWEKAARGMDGGTYPWGGSEPDCSKAQYNGCEGDTVPVGSRPAGVSSYGVHDMAGNVTEWVADWYDADYYAHSPTWDPQGPPSGSYKVLRGGFWYDSQSSLVAAYRGRVAGPDISNDYVGFRCAMSAPK